jgi:hypothetical protein
MLAVISSLLLSSLLYCCFILGVMLLLFSSVYPVLALLLCFGCPDQVDLFWLSSYGTSYRAGMQVWLSCSSCFTLDVQFGCPVLFVLFLLPSSVLSVKFWLTYSVCPILAVMLLQNWATDSSF